MKNYKKEFNYILYYSDSTNEQDDLHFYAEDFGQEKMQGIFKLTLGLHFPEILFLPEIENISKSWPPYIDYRLIQSAEDICKALLLMESYIILPCNEWAGQVKILESEIKNPISSDPETYYGYQSTIFFITDEEYENYKQEAEKIDELNDLEEHRGYETMSQTRTEDLEKYMKLPVFIKEKVLPYFNDHDLYDISRIKDEKGNVIFTQTIGNK
ncbi:hypothetical protein [Chryseobacterium jejuense]|uniref:Uncharacterized protein n=1 Tax=Chryseobacterium jejuense TaxID=445960 RepID=A0A2X2VQB9_CHRJE|nr:hypothetical protein [Chryseobacterium jejuense]SDJ09009.1 hypothetical protein SAMN05421542_2603 [Chryseobacterium jejuense]SQB27841.1 Uncharacterised protein [Chryseobacterium jejuense]